MKGCIGVEVFRHCQPRENFRRMRAEDDFIRHAFAGRGPNDGQFRLGFQKCGRGRDAAGMFRMTGARVAGAAFVGDDFHKQDLITVKCGWARKNLNVNFRRVNRFGNRGRNQMVNG